MKIDDFLVQKLQERHSKGNKRQLPQATALKDFVSNDYLGLARNRELAERIRERWDSEGFIANGGTGSRLLSGNHSFYKELERMLSAVFQAESALVFNSGYHANQAVVASIPQKGDTILYDQLSHVCLKEGAWLSKADSYAFFHNDLEDLERRLVQAKGNVFVLTETVFSMDGDVAPLEEMVALCERYGANLIVDEAHSTGVYGADGGGWLIEKDLHQRVFCRIYTFGKAMGVHGACVAGSKALAEYLVNFGRPFIYTTSMPPHSVLSIAEAFQYLRDHIELQQVLRSKVELFVNHLQRQGIKPLSSTTIQPIMVAGNSKARKVAQDLQQGGFDVRPILAPTVKEGAERLRISLHTSNTDEEIVQLAEAIGALL
ncbi:MAG: 8-amino-7-oxononanoate synthase [Cyclobacteriaceae bacterium]|nr:8-amino-7-oxononanoate synthase [Cyclobacteriaceae bacterium HetDA_MAG_MS6]